MQELKTGNTTNAIAKTPSFARVIGDFLLRLLLSLPAGLAIGMMFSLAFGSITDIPLLSVDVAERAWWETAQVYAEMSLLGIGIAMTVCLGQLHNAKIDRYLLVTAMLAVVVVVAFGAKIILGMWIQSLGN